MQPSKCWCVLYVRDIHCAPLIRGRAVKSGDARRLWEADSRFLWENCPALTAVEILIDRVHLWPYHPSFLHSKAGLVGDSSERCSWGWDAVAGKPRESNKRLLVFVSLYQPPVGIVAAHFGARKGAGKQEVVRRKRAGYSDYMSPLDVAVCVHNIVCTCCEAKDSRLVRVFSCKSYI